MSDGATTNTHTHTVSKDWKNTMAVNVLNTVQAVATSHGDISLPPMTVFESSVEPMAIAAFFEKKKWRHLRKFTKVEWETFYWLD